MTAILKRAFIHHLLGCAGRTLRRCRNLAGAGKNREHEHFDPAVHVAPWLFER
jgi:hypothetical protein